MSGDREIQTIFSEILVAEATVDSVERELYAHDLAAVPSFLSRALLRATPTSWSDQERLRRSPPFSNTPRIITYR